MTNGRRAATITETLVVLIVTMVLLVASLATMARAADRHRGLSSADNLRTLAVAHASYAADWNDRQLTFIDDFISTYGNGVSNAFSSYWAETGSPHPPVELGWGRLSRNNDRYTRLAYRNHGNCANGALHQPVEFTGEGCNENLAHFGAFRLHNASQLNQYLDARFYTDTFYAPKDEVVIDAIDAGGCFDGPGGYCRFAEVDSPMGDVPAWSSYCMSAAAMFNPAVLAHDDPDDEDFNGFVWPWDLDDGFRSPSLAQALYPDLKSNILEHHWLQNNPGEQCNPDFPFATYGDPACEPYYFNHAAASAPLTLFYDGHIAEILVQDAVDDDAIVRDENNANWGLWSADTPWGIDGYRSEFSFDGVQTSFHVLTTDGIRGRDVLGGGAFPSRRPPPVVGRHERPEGKRRHPAPNSVPAVRASVTD